MHIQSLTDGRDRTFVVWGVATIASVAVAVALRIVWHSNCDVSWLLYVAERTLGSVSPYRAYLEVNPPASILIYLPAVALARVAHIAAETMTNVLVFLGAASSIALSGRLVSRFGILDSSQAPVLAFMACLVLLVMPLDSFGEREHIALLAILPMLASLSVRISGRCPSVVEIILVGLGAGIAISIKPVFALALVGPLFVLLRSQGWRALVTLSEAWIMLGIASGYAIAAALVFPDYATRILPLMTGIYLPARLPLLDLVLVPPFGLWTSLVVLCFLLKSDANIVSRLSMQASAGFQAAYLIQGKGFFYHDFPAVAVAILGCAAAITAPDHRISTRRPRSSLWVVPLAGAVLAGCLIFAEYYDLDKQAPGLSQAVRAISPHPRLLMIGDDMRLGRVFAHEAGGEAIGSAPIPWITVYAYYATPQAETDPRFAAPIRMERELYAADIDRDRPDAILIQGQGWLNWTRRNADLSRAMSRYRLAGRYGSVTVWRPIAADRIMKDEDIP